MKIVTFAILACMLISSANCYSKDIDLYEDRTYDMSINVRRKKTIRITLSDELITQLESDEKRFFWEAISNDWMRITLSSVAKPVGG